MPARIRKIRHDEDTRRKIQTSQLVNRLSDHVLGKIELTNTQVRAAEILLSKTLPNLVSTQMDMNAAVTVNDPVDRPAKETHQEWIERRKRELLLVAPAGSAD